MALYDAVRLPERIVAAENIRSVGRIAIRHS